MNNPVFLEVVFENVESIIIPIERVHDIKFGELAPIKKDHYEKNSYSTNYVSLKITYESEKELNYNPRDYSEPLGMFINNPLSNRVHDRPNILGRLTQHNDIVCVQYLNEKEEDYQTVYVPWADTSGEYNTYMNIKKNNGILEIEIKKE